jgi:hypothetical protein
MTELLHIEKAPFARSFGNAPMAVTHNLANHPLLSLEAIAELADEMSPAAVERHNAHQPLVLPGGAPELEGKPSDTVRNIETNGAWMVLWNVEDSPRYAALLNECLDEVERATGLPAGDMRNRQAFLFMTTPNGLTPVHFDPEHNLLLQIRGTKEMNVGRFPDPGDMDRELVRYYGGGHRNLESVPEDVTCFHMNPGDGTYVHPFAPHFVRNGPSPSVSFSITFRTRDSERFEYAHRFNAKMKKVRVPLGRPGAFKTADRAKALLVASSDHLHKRTLGRREKTPTR